MYYLGSKKKLNNFIEDIFKNEILEKTSTFCDLFAGTGSVGLNLSRHFKNTIFNDIQFYSYEKLDLITKFKNFNEHESFVNNFLEVYFKKLNNLKGYAGFITKNYSPYKDNNRMYFTIENAKKIDGSIRLINSAYEKGVLSDDLFQYLKVAVMEAADKVANVTGVYEAYLKKFKKAAQRDILFKKIEIDNFCTSNPEVYREDASVLIRKIKGDVLYLDPPYNSRQYSSNYHLLETIIKNDNPEIKGITGVRTDVFKSQFCRKLTARDSIEDIIKHANFKFIMLSYSNEGNVSVDELKKMLEKYGTISENCIEYKRYKSDCSKTRNTGAKSNLEYLFVLKKGI